MNIIFPQSDVSICVVADLYLMLQDKGLNKIEADHIKALFDAYMVKYEE